MGRTARAGSTGKALLFLTVEEVGFIRYLKQHKVSVESLDVKWSKVANIQSQLEMLISKNRYLMQSAMAAFKSFVRAYYSHSLKDIYSVSKLNFDKVCKSFGLTVPPPIDLGKFSLKRTSEMDYGPSFKKQRKTKLFRRK